MNFTAKQVLEYFWDGLLPVDLERIAKNSGLILQPNNDSNDIVSSLFVNEKNQIIIQYKKDENFARQRFAIAHSLGHIFLGHLYKKNNWEEDKCNFFSTQTNSYERSANMFALSLLIPENIVKFVISKHHVTDITKLAQIFVVSEVAMAEKLKTILKY